MACSIRRTFETKQIPLAYWVPKATRKDHVENCPAFTASVHTNLELSCDSVGRSSGNVKSLENAASCLLDSIVQAKHGKMSMLGFCSSFSHPLSIIRRFRLNTVELPGAKFKGINDSRRQKMLREWFFWPSLLLCFSS